MNPIGLMYDFILQNLNSNFSSSMRILLSTPVYIYNKIYLIWLKQFDHKWLFCYTIDDFDCIIYNKYWILEIKYILRRLNENVYYISINNIEIILTNYKC